MVARVHLNTDCVDRQALVEFCLCQTDHQYVAIGWSYIYGGNQIQDYRSYYEAVKKNVKRLNPALNIFREAKKDDLFWTRDLDGVYWICRAKGGAESYCDVTMDIGARIPVEAYQVGLEVPGRIKTSFNRARGGTAERIRDELDGIIVEYSKHIYNVKAGKSVYTVKKLVISYIQLQEGYYVLSNSIANKSTTVKIECEFISRDSDPVRKAVVQVKGGDALIDAADYVEYVKKKYEVYLYASRIHNLSDSGCTEITRKMLEDFYKKYKAVLPESITHWEDLFS